MDELLSSINELLTKRYLKKYEACEYANVSNDTLDRWIKDKGLNPIIIDGITRYDRLDIDKFMEKYKIKPCEVKENDHEKQHSRDTRNI